MRVLVTGAAGWTAQAVLAALLRAGHEVMGLDLPGSASSRGAASEVRWITGSITDPADVERAARGVDAILHLAVAVGSGDYESPETPFSTNVLGTYNVFDAARRSGVRRVVLISSAPVHLAPFDGKMDARSGWRSSAGGDHLYDLTKRLQEDISRDFCETYRMDVVVLRAGHVVDGEAGVDKEGTPLAELDYCRDGWLCRYDLAEASLRALSLDAGGCRAFHVIGSRVARDRFDLGRTESELGFRPRELFEEYE